MKSFYNYLLQQRLSPSAALRQAQFEMWRKNHPPFSWAAYSLQGDPE
jgi:CHAT domain-containing protein